MSSREKLLVSVPVCSIPFVLTDSQQTHKNNHFSKSSRESGTELHLTATLNTKVKFSLVCIAQGLLRKISLPKKQYSITE